MPPPSDRQQRLAEEAAAAAHPTPAVVIAPPVATPTVQAQVTAALTAYFASHPIAGPTACKFMPSLQPIPIPVPIPTPVPAPTPAPTTASMGGGFIIGVEQQPPDSFAKWVGRGINTMVTVPNVAGVVDGKSWVAACRKFGLRYFIQSDAVYDWADINADPLCLAVMNGDENNDDKIKVVDFQAQVATIRTKTPKRVFCNNDGTKEQWPDAGYEPAGYIQASDWNGWDKYSICRGEGHDSIVPTIQALAASHKAMSGGKPFLVYVECSNQNLAAEGWTGPNARGPTPDEQNTTVDAVVAAGAIGIIYFPQQVAGGDYGFQWDVMTVDNVAAMVAKNKALAAMTSINETN